jgi:hypothetical protein
MSLLITRGLGTSGGTTLVGDRLYGTIVVEDRLEGALEEEEAPIGEISEPILISGAIQTEDVLAGTLETADVLEGVLHEEYPPMSDVRINMYLRDDRTLSLTVTDKAGAAVDLTGSKLWFTVKTKTSDADTESVIQKRNTAAGGGNDEIEILDGPAGSAAIYMVPSDTDGVDPGIYVFDVQTTLSDGKTYTVLRGRISFREDVTKALT